MQKIILSIIMVWLTISVFAQNDDANQRQSRFTFGASLEAGYSGTSDYVENYYPNPFGDYNQITSESRRPGYAMGLWGAYRLGKRWDIQLGVNYGQWDAFASIEGEGFNTEGVLNSYSRERYQLRQSLLRMPLEGRFYFGQPHHRARPFLQLGVQTAYLLRHLSVRNAYYGAMGQESYESIYATIVDLDSEWTDYRRWQWSLTGGFGVKMDRVSLSIQRNWRLDGLGYESNAIFVHYPDFCGIGNFIGDSVYQACPHGVRQLRQTSLRFSYLLF